MFTFVRKGLTTMEDTASPGNSRRYGIRQNKCNWLYQHRWIPIAFSSACLYAIMAILTSTLDGEVSATAMSSIRGIIPAVVILIVIVHRRKSLLIANLSDMGFHSMNSLLLAALLYGQVYSYTHMAAADASAIIYAYIALTGIFARLVLKESFAIFEVLMVLITFMGILLITRPPFLFRFFDESLDQSWDLVAPLVAFATAVISAVHAVLNRAMGRNDLDVVLVVFYPMAFSAVCLGTVAAIFGDWSIPCSVFTRLRVLAVAVSGGLANVLFIYALSIENAVYVTLVLINDSFLVFVMTVLFFGYRPYWTSVLGILLIIGSSVAVVVKKIVVFQDAGERNSSADTLTMEFVDSKVSMARTYIPLEKVTSV